MNYFSNHCSDRWCWLCHVLRRWEFARGTWRSGSVLSCCVLASGLGGKLLRCGQWKQWLCL